jgi:hypothetical protein
VNTKRRWRELLGQPAHRSGSHPSGGMTTHPTGAEGPLGKRRKKRHVQQGATTSRGTRHATGQDGAIDDVYAALSPMVLGYLRRFVPHDEAEDVLQRVFYEVWRHKDRYDPSKSRLFCRIRGSVRLVRVAGGTARRAPAWPG